MAFRRYASDRGRLRPAHIFLAAALLIIGAGLRVRGAYGELWLDEIWSLNIAKGLTAWHQAFWDAPLDNNHPLNTAWIYLMGQGRDPWVYRLLSIITGTMTILVTGLVAARSTLGPTSVRLLVAMLLTATLYPFVHFGSEARGYAPMMLCAMLAFSAVEDADQNVRRARWTYGLAGFLGLLSHLSILPILFALSISFTVRQRLQGVPLAQAFHAAVRLNGPFIAGVLAYTMTIAYGFFLHHNVLAFGGSTLGCLDAPCFTSALDSITRFTVGGFAAPWTGLYTGLYSIFVGGAIAWLGTLGNRRALPLGLILLGVPLLFFLTNQPAVPHARYFIGVFAFLPVLSAEIVGEISGRTQAARLGAGLFVVALVSVNAWANSRFFQAGRGDYARTLERILKDQDGAPITLGTEMPFQLKTVMNETRDRLAPRQRITYVTLPDIPRTKPRWLISVTLEAAALPATACTGGLFYTLDSVHGYWGLAGSPWGLYVRRDRPAPKDCRWLTDPH